MWPASSAADSRCTRAARQSLRPWPGVWPRRSVHTTARPSRARTASRGRRCPTVTTPAHRCRDAVRLERARSVSMTLRCLGKSPGKRSPLAACSQQAQHRAQHLIQVRRPGLDQDGGCCTRGRPHGLCRRKAKKKVVTAVIATYPRKALGKDAASEVLAESLPDTGRRGGMVALAIDRFGAERQGCTGWGIVKFFFLTTKTPP